MDKKIKKDLKLDISCGCGSCNEEKPEKKDLKLDISCDCGNCGGKESGNEDGNKHFNSEKLGFYGSIVGAIIFLATVLFGVVPKEYELYALIVAYLLLGGEVLFTALKNLIKGNLFDEQFLMSVATLAAFGIKQYDEAVGVMLFYRIGEYFEDKAMDKSRDDIIEALDLRADNVNLVVGDKTKVIPTQDVKVGDVILIRVGDRIPVDSIIIEGTSQLDTSPITGEAVPVKVGPKDSILSGSINTLGVIQVKVEKTLEDSLVTKILDSVENAAKSKPKLERFITKFSKVYTPIVVIIAILVAVIPGILTGDWDKWIYVAATFLVISCPCALVLSVPLAFYAGIGAASKHGIIFKGGIVMEALKNIKAVVVDKTGTVTKGEFVLQKINAVDKYSEDEVLRLTASVEAVSNHPIARSINVKAKAKNLELLKVSEVEEYAGKGISALIEGKRVLCGNEGLMSINNIDLSSRIKNNFGTEILVACEDKFIGSVIISDTIKPGAKKAITDIKAEGIATAMLTGDSRSSAEEVALATGIETVYSKLLPQDKFAKLQEIRNEFGAVMFVGDGINDTPVLAGADVGAAMGTGADSAVNAADVVFMNSDVDSIAKSIAIARKVSSIAWQNVIFALTIKTIIMIVGIAGFASMWAAVFADTGVTLICIVNSIRIIYQKE